VPTARRLVMTSTASRDCMMSFS